LLLHALNDQTFTGFAGIERIESGEITRRRTEKMVSRKAAKSARIQTLFPLRALRLCEE